MEAAMEKIVSPETVLSHLKPGMSIFLGTGAAEPRTLVKYLMKSKAGNLEDLELIQLVSFGEAISPKTLRFQKFRLKTFFAGWAADEAIEAGRIDLIPSRFAWIPKLIESENIRINASFIQVTPPDGSGNCSLGIAVDAARQAMEKASLVVGEINPFIPRTIGDTFVNVSDFDLMIHSEDPPFYIDRWPVDDIYNTVAGHVAGLIDDGHCIAFSIGPLFEALTPHLAQKRHLGIHSPFFTDALMDLVKSGAVSNSRKETYRGQSLVSYALGTKNLMQWLDQIYFTQSGRLYPSEISVDQIFKPDIKIKFRPTKPSDEEEMRRLFYRFSDESVYARYLGHIQAMPHAKTQEYVNIDWSQVMSIVGVVKRAGKERIIAEARYIREPVRPFAEIVLVVDEEYQGIGIGSYLFGLLARLAKEKGLKGFTAEVLFSNTGMMKVLKKVGFPIETRLEDSVYHLEISLEGDLPGIDLNPKPRGPVLFPLKDDRPIRQA
jgi:GNAT superfamily N-acetyltransferase